MMLKTDPLLTVNQVAEIFAVKPYTVREWLREERIRGVKLNNQRWRIRQSEMERFANEVWGS